MCYAMLNKEHEHPGTLLSVGGPETNPPWEPMEDSILCMLGLSVFIVRLSAGNTRMYH